MAAASSVASGSGQSGGSDQLGERKGESDRSAEIYFPYPDTVVRFAYPVGPRSPIGYIGNIAARQSSLDSMKRVVNSALKMDIDSIPDGKFALIFPFTQLGIEQDAIGMIGYLQYLRHTDPAMKRQTDSLSVSKLHLGSPHQYYRWLVTTAGASSTTSTASPIPSGGASSGASGGLPFQIVDSEPVYPSIVGRTIDVYPLSDEVESVLVGTNVPLTTVDVKEVKQSLLPHYNPKIGGIYCGDYQQDWESAYLEGKAGSYYRCRNLAILQGLRPPGPSVSSTGPLSMSSRLGSSGPSVSGASIDRRDQTDRIRSNIREVRSEIDRGSEAYRVAALELARLKAIPTFER